MKRSEIWQMRKLKVGDVLKRVKDTTTLDDNQQYKRVTIKMNHKGVSVRDIELGINIGTKSQFFIREGQFLLSKIDARNGAFGIVPPEADGAIITGNFWAFDVNQKELNIDLFHIMTSLPFFDELSKKASSGTTNRQYLDEKKFLAQEITLPPIEEQDIFITHFKKIQIAHRNTLAELQTQSTLIAKLRASILSDAVSGRLVPQDPNDEPASILLEKIRVEKECLIKEGKIKREKPLPPIAADEIPYELPEGWIWCKLSTITEVGTGATPLKSTSDYYNGTIPWVTSSATGDRFIHRADVLITEKALRETNCKIYPTGTLILAMYGQGKTRGQISELCIDATINQACASIRLFLFDKTTNEYIKLFFEKHYVELRELAAGGAQPNLNLQKIKDTLIPLPPFSEQQRIISKVKQLMSTCDALEAEVAKSCTETDRLMQTILKEAFDR